MQLACLMGDVKEVERVAAIEGYNLEHLILGKRPMHLAAVANQPDVIRALAKAGAKLNGSDGTSNRSKPIHVCAEVGAVEAADALVKLGARSETRPGDGLGPLHIACKHNHPEVIAVLLRAGANPDAASREGTPRELAELYHCTRCVDAIDDYIIDRHDDKKLASFHKMSITSPKRHLGAHLDPGHEPPKTPKSVKFKDQEHSERDQALIEKALHDLEMQCCTRPLAAMQAALMSGDHAKVQKLLSWGGDCNAMCNGRRPLHCAVLGDSVECLKILLAQKDIDVNGRDGVSFQTPLHVACDIACDPDIVVVLANFHGVHIDATDAKFRRPLHRAAEEGDEMACRLLVHLGADARAKDTTGQRPRDYSKAHGYTQLSGVLAKAEAAAVRKKNARRRTMAMAKLKHVSHRGDGAFGGGSVDSTRSFSTIGSTKSAKSRSSRRQQKTHFPPASPTGSPATAKYRDKDEVVHELESVLNEVRTQPHGHLKVDSLVSEASRAVHLGTPQTTWDTKRGSVAKALSPDKPLPTSLDERFQQYDDSRPMTAEEPPEDLEYDWRRPPKTPVTPPTDTPNISQLLVPPDDTTWRNEHIPEPPASPPKKAKRKRRKSRGEDTTPPGTSRNERRRGDGRARRKKYVPPLGGKSPAVDIAKFFRGDSGDEAATAYAVVGKHGPGYDGDYDDEVDDGSQWQQIEVDNEKAEPASIDGEYGGGAFSSYNRVHVAVSPIKADPMGFGSSVPTGRSSPTLKARG
jgi:ankyrin repeat protein